MLNISNRKNKIIELIVAAVLVSIGVVLRLIPHLPNFTPVLVISLFAGVYFSKKIALIVPIVTMLISDAFIGSYDLKVMLSVYSSLMLCSFLGFLVKKNKKWYTILGGSLSCAVLFYLITNFAVFAFTPWYPKNIIGLIDCYVLALPFFKYTILGNLFYAPVFFGIYEGVKSLIAKTVNGYTAHKSTAV